MIGKKILKEEILNDAELDNVTGGTGGCGTPALDDIQDEVITPIIPPIKPGSETDVLEPPVTPPYIPPINPGKETDVLEPPIL